jgi:hypothetical protein
MESVQTQLFPNPAIPGDITASFALSGTDIGTGSFESGFSPSGGPCPQNAFVCANGTLQIDAVTVAVASDVTPATPLPAALPLFATGLGAFGLFGRRRKRKGV